MFDKLEEKTFKRAKVESRFLSVNNNQNYDNPKPEPAFYCFSNNFLRWKVF